MSICIFPQLPAHLLLVVLTPSLLEKQNQSHWGTPNPHQRRQKRWLARSSKTSLKTCHGFWGVLAICKYLIYIIDGYWWVKPCSHKRYYPPVTMPCAESMLVPTSVLQRQVAEFYKAHAANPLRVLRGGRAIPIYSAKVSRKCQHDSTWLVSWKIPIISGKDFVSKNLGEWLVQ